MSLINVSSLNVFFVLWNGQQGCSDQNLFLIKSSKNSSAFPKLWLVCFKPWKQEFLFRHWSQKGGRADSLVYRVQSTSNFPVTHQVQLEHTWCSFQRISKLIFNTHYFAVVCSIILTISWYCFDESWHSIWIKYGVIVKLIEFEYNLSMKH